MPDIFDRLMLLKQSSVFSMVSTDDLRVVAQSLEQQDYFSGDCVFEINDQGDHLYLRSGSALTRIPAVTTTLPCSGRVTPSVR